MKNFCNLIGLEQWYFSLIWNILTRCNIYSNFKKFFADGDFCVIPNDPAYPECQNKVKVSRALKYYKQCSSNYLFIIYYLYAQITAQPPIKAKPMCATER